MLLLSRKRGQSVVINDDIEVTIIAVDRSRVQIGIRAPGHVPIYRREIVDRMVARREIEPLDALPPAEATAV
jgi:carbon storage regulator